MAILEQELKSVYEIILILPHVACLSSVSVIVLFSVISDLVPIQESLYSLEFNILTYTFVK